MSQKTKKEIKKTRPATHDRAVSCEQCKMAFAVPKNSPVDYVPSHKCEKKEKEYDDSKSALSEIMRDLQYAQFTSGLVVVQQTIETILSLHKKIKSEMGSLVVLNIVVAVYVLFMVFLVVNYPYFV